MGLYPIRDDEATPRIGADQGEVGEARIADGQLSPKRSVGPLPWYRGDFVTADSGQLSLLTEHARDGLELWPEVGDGVTG
jgi:hypothetical protein